MLKKTITFNDFNNNPRTEDHYFNLSKTECMKLEMGTTGGLTEMIERVVEAQDIPTIIKVFEELILKSYGKKSADGREFIKSEELSRSFSQTGAYDKLFLELTSDAKAAAAFFNGVIDGSNPAPETAITNVPPSLVAVPSTN